MCFPIQNPGGHYFLPSHEASLWAEVQKLMDRNPYLVGQNITFDLEYLFDYGLEPSGVWMDTMLSHAILYPEFPKGLDFLASLYTEMPYYKGEGKITNPKITTQDLHEYNNKDTITTLWCALEIEKQLKARGLWPVHEFVTSEIGLALEMQRNRLPVSPEKREQLKQWITDAQANLDAKWAETPTLRKLAGQKPTSEIRPNVNSPKQVQQFLYGAYPDGLGLKQKTWNGKIQSDEDTLNELKAQHPDLPEIGWILEERHLRKLNSSYLDIELEQDGTIGGSWCVHGTETGRWTSGKSPRGRGINLQTAPKSVRWMVVPPARKEAA
jgi:DNA polymerase I-like protein with 3'-5' exonuclease and polymerase domains